MMQTVDLPRFSDSRAAMLRSGFTGALLFAAIFGLACESLPSRWPFSPKATSFTEEELREELIRFANRFSSRVSAAGDQITAQTSDPKIRRAALLWRLRLVPAIREASALPDPQEAYAATAYWVVMMRRYFTEGPVGAGIFGSGQPIAIEASESLEEEIFSIAFNFLDQAQVDQFRREVGEFAKSHAIAGRDFSGPELQQTLQDVRTQGRLDWLIEIPLSPFRALSGVSSGASAMHAFNDTTIRFAAIVESLPEQIRWQIELLLYDVESRTPFGDAVAAIEALSESSRVVADAAAQLPEEVRETLEQAGGSLSEANRALEMVQDLVGPLRETAEEVRLAGASWGELFGEQEGGELQSGARPFNVRDYEVAARSIGEAANDLQALVDGLNALVDGQGIETTLSGLHSSLDRAETGGRSVVDHLAWRGFQLMLIFFLLLAGYRLLVFRVGRAKR